MSAELFAGIDVGSSATKCVLLVGGGTPVAHSVAPSGFDFAEAAARVLREALDRAQASQEDIVYCVSTGYGREGVPLADRHVTEITCHARGARAWYPQVRHIVDIGGQDAKVIWNDVNGKMADYRMNTKCAAGTGTFLESIALKLGVSLKDIDDLAMHSSAATVVNSYCTVFAGTEVLERIKAGEPREDISMGLFRSIAMRVAEMMGARDGDVAVTGGVVAHCKAMVRALNEKLDTEVLLGPLPQHAGAFGAALSARASAASSVPTDQRAARESGPVGEGR